MNRRRLREILKQHELWLSSGGRQSERANLCGADLRGANLNWANLSRANLAGANLSRAYLINANLRDADLRGADLWGADLIGSILGTHWMKDALVSDSQLPWLATDPNFPTWVSELMVKER